MKSGRVQADAPPKPANEQDLGAIVRLEQEANRLLHRIRCSGLPKSRQQIVIKYIRKLFTDASED